MSKAQKGNVQTLQVLKKNVHYFEPFLQLEEPWHIRRTDLGNYDYQQRVEKLKSCSAVDFCGYESFPVLNEKHSKNRVKTYKLTEKAKDVLETAIPDETLPCGKHRVHVDNPKRLDGLSCKYCREESDRKTIPVIEPEFDKDTVRDLL